MTRTARQDTPAAAATARRPAEPVIVAEEVSRWYGQVRGVNQLSVEIGRGITGLLGPNGAGKSTLLKLIVGQLKPSRGRLSVLGETVWQSRSLLGRIGYCPEHEQNYDEASGREVVQFLTELHGFSRSEAAERAERTLQRVGLTEAADRMLGTYSKGMRQRLKLAQALAHDPEVLVLDEPLTGCDPVARGHLLDLIRALGEHGVCVLVSSHVLHEIEAMTSEILLMAEGRILAEGNIYDIRALIDRHPHRIRVVSSAPRRLASALVSEPFVESIRVLDDDRAVDIETRTPDLCYPALPRIARAAEVELHALSSPDNTLEAVFRYLTSDTPMGASDSGKHP